MNDEDGPIVTGFWGSLAVFGFVVFLISVVVAHLNGWLT